MATIKVRAVGDALVQNFDALESGVKRFVGRVVSKVEPAVCSICERSMQGDTCGACSRPEFPVFAKHEFKPTGEVVEISARPEHMQAMREGHLKLVTEHHDHEES